jgi:drug/metabolite transporter (DMT)-like permease
MADSAGVFRRALSVSQDDAAPAGGAPVGPSRTAIAAAFGALYLIWGSTYLAIRIAVESVPPFSLAGVRFAAAGAAMLLWRHYRGGIPFPTRRQWLGGGLVGVCLVLLSNVCVVFAEKSLSSGVTALFAAGTPLLIALFNGHRTGTSLGTRRAIGLALGTAGMVLLGSAAFAAVHAFTPLALMAIASLAWAVGSTYGRSWTQSSDVMMASATQMLVGGVLATLVGIASGELNWLHAHAITWQSGAAWLYLSIVGSFVAYPVFQWLLSVADATAVASYTYVNPIVAVGLGVLLAGEVVSTRTMIATAVLIPAVVLVVTGAPRKELEVKEET